MGILKPTDWWDSWNSQKKWIEKSTQKRIWEVFNQEKNNVDRLQSIWITINWKDKENINRMSLTDTEIENLRRIKKLWIFILAEDVEDIKDIILTNTEIENVKKIKKIWGIYIDSKDIKAIKEIEITEIDLKNIEKLKFLIIHYRDIKNIKGLTDKEIENIIKIKEMRINISEDDIKYIKDLTDKEIDNIKTINDLWICIRIEDIESLKNVTNIDLKHIEELKEIIWDSRNIKHIKWLTDKEVENIKTIIKRWIQISAEDIKIIKDIELTNKEKWIIKNLNEEWVKLKANELIIIRENQEILETQSKNKYEWHNYTPEQIEILEYYKKWTIVDNIQQYVQNTIKENRDIETHEIINAIKEGLATISQSERMIIISKIYIIVDKFNTVRKYLDFNNWPYKTPKELLCAMKWIDDSKINDVTDDITVRQHWIWLMFFVWDKKTYENIGIKWSWWCYLWSCAIPDLEWTCSLVNWKDSGENVDIIWHEWQHNRNDYFMPDVKRWSSLTRAKDEIIAYIRWYSKDGYYEWQITEVVTEHIIKNLTLWENEWWLYQYIKWEERERHKEKIKKLITYVNDILKLASYPNSWLGRNEVISMLAITPTEKRERLHKTITETNKSIIEKIEEENGEDDGEVL